MKIYREPSRDYMTVGMQYHFGAAGLAINDIALSDNELLIKLEDGTTISAVDDGQQCCESRWLHTDDDLPGLIGEQFNGLEVRRGGADAWPEEQFLLLHTDIGVATIVAYNEHNGYYGGFDLRACRLEAPSYVGLDVKGIEVSFSLWCDNRYSRTDIIFTRSDGSRRIYKLPAHYPLHLVSQPGKISPCSLRRLVQVVRSYGYPGIVKANGWEISL